MSKAYKPKSPPTPSRSLPDSVADVAKLYDAYSHGAFAKAEVASTLEVSAGSGPFAARLFTLRAFGLIKQDGDKYSVTPAFMLLNTTDKTDAKFKQAALDAIRGSATFRELLDEFGNRLPPVDKVAGRLETQKKFNPAPAKTAANVLEKSLKYAGILDGSNNIVPVRSTAANGGDAGGSSTTENGQEDADHEQLPTDVLSMEIPVGDDRKVVIRYPRDLTNAEAKKVGNVLAAVVS